MRLFTPGPAVVGAATGIVCAVLAAAAPAATASRPTITKLTVGGSVSSPIFTLSGHGLAVPAPNPKASPSNQQLCPLSISGDAGFDYGTQFSLLAWDAQPSSSNDLLYSAGRYRPALDELDCIGIVVLAHTTTKIRFTFGHGYVQYYTAKPRLLRNGDVVEVVLRGAAFATVVHFH